MSMRHTSVGFERDLRVEGFAGIGDGAPKIDVWPSSSKSLPIHRDSFSRRWLASRQADRK
jgi:hypothetical protein